MHAKNFVVNKSSDGHAVENILEFFPKSNAVSILALVVKSVNSVNLATLVISSQQEKVFLELYFVGKQQDNSF